MIIVAIDEINLKKASDILDNLDSEKCMVKIGSVSFNSIGHDIISYASKVGTDRFSGITRGINNTQETDHFAGGILRTIGNATTT